MDRSVKPTMRDDKARILRYASVKGSYAPPSRPWWTVVQLLVRDGLLEESDGYPGAYQLTTASERVAADLAEA